MTFITGEQLGLLTTPKEPRRQLNDLMNYLDSQNNGCLRVCTLYGMQGTGTTTLLLQASNQETADAGRFRQ
jgi:hypothetical protein